MSGASPHIPNRRTLSQWIDGGAATRPSNEPEIQAPEPFDFASELVVHGLLKELTDRDVESEEQRIARVLQAIDVETAPLQLPRRIPVGVLAAIAACLLLATALAIWSSSGNEPQRVATDRDSSTLAAVVQVIDAEFGSAEALRTGDRLSPRVIQIQSGFLRLAFDDGVEVTLQGPAEYELLAVGKTRMNAGLLTATVPPGAEGFTVETPTAEVIDLGTSFGIDLSEDGISHVSVFEGEVQVANLDSDESKRLKEGDSVRIASGAAIESVDFDPQPFTKVWPIASGVERSTEAFRFMPPWPRQIKLIRSDEHISILPEGPPTTLQSPLRINASLPGEYSRAESLTATEIPAGQAVRSFLLVFHPEKSGPNVIKPLSGSITFDAPVLGLIVQHEELQASARRFVRRGPRFLREEQQLELTDTDDGDVVTLSQDRRTVTLNLKTRARHGEMMRVIVAASNSANRKTGSGSKE